MPLSSSASGSYFYPVMQLPYAGSVAQPVQYLSSSAFVGNAYSTIFPSTDVSRWNTLNVTIVNGAVNILKSGSVEFSPNNVDWEVYNTAAFTPLAISTAASLQMTGMSKQFIRVRGWPSGSAGALTGSVTVFVNGNN